MPVGCEARADTHNEQRCLTTCELSVCVCLSRDRAAIVCVSCVCVAVLVVMCVVCGVRAGCMQNLYSSISLNLPPARRGTRARRLSRRDNMARGNLLEDASIPPAKMAQAAAMAFLIVGTIAYTLHIVSYERARAPDNTCPCETLVSSSLGKSL